MITQRIFWVAVTLLVFVDPAAAGIRAVDFAEENSALIVHDVLLGKSELEQLRSTLIEAYGFSPNTTTLLTESDASLEGIREALEILVKRHRRTSGQVLLYLSLPIYRDEDETYFVPSGADKEKPWELLNVSELVKRLSQLRSFNMMVVYPSCQIARSSDIYSLRQSEVEAVTSLVYGDILSIDIFGVCDRETMRIGRDMGPIVSTPERRALLAQVISEVLSSAGDDRTDFFGTEYLVEQFNAKGEELGLMSGRVQLPDYGVSGYMFYPQPSELSRYQAAYIEAEHYLQAEELLFRLASVAFQGTDEFLAGAVTFLKNVSESQNAALGLVAGASDRQRLSLRATALEVLANLETPQADVALFNVAENAAVSSSIRGQAITFIERRISVVDADVTRIRALVFDPDEAVSVSAIRSLGRLKDPDSAATLMQLVENGAGLKTKTAAIQSLATIKDPNSQNFLLLRLAVERSSEIRVSLIKSIGELGRARQATMELLRLLDNESDTRVVRSILAALPKVSVASTDADVVRDIAQRAKDGDETQRINAVYALGDIDTVDSEKTLRAVLRQAGWGSVPEAVRIAAAETLGDLREDSGIAVKEIEKAAFDNSAQLRKAAVDALGKIGNPASIRLLADKLKDADDDVRAAASTALRRLNTIENGQLIDNLSSDEERIRYEAASRLRQAEPSDAVITALATALGDESAQVRTVAQIALSESRSETVETALYDSLSSKNAQQRNLAVRILGTRQTEASLAMLLDYDDSNPIVKAELVRALGNYEDEQATSRILDALETGYLEVQIASIRALAKHRDHPDIREKLEVLARTSRSSTIQKEAIRALGSSQRVKAPTRFEVN